MTEATPASTDEHGQRPLRTGVMKRVVPEGGEGSSPVAPVRWTLARILASNRLAEASRR